MHARSAPSCTRSSPSYFGCKSLSSTGKRLKNAGISRLLLASALGTALGWSTSAFGAIQLFDFRDTLDRAITGPDLIGGTDDPALHVYVADREQFDSNVFRLSDAADVKAVVRPTASKEDHINSPIAGLDGQWVFGRQIVDLTLQAQDNLYSKNSGLNNVSTDDKLAWNWALGGVLSGQVGIDYHRALLSFVNSVVYSRNTYSQTESFATGRYQLGPRWTLFAGILNSSIVLADPASKGNDSRSKVVDAGIEFAANVRDSFGLDYRYTDSRYPNGIVLTGSSFDPDYREEQVRLLVKRSITEKTSIDLSGGLLKRQYTNTLIGSFSGPIWRGSLGWQPTDKTQIIVSAWRDLQAYLTDESNYYRTTGVSLSPTWTMSGKITLALLASREKQTYIGSSSIVGAQTGRQDTVNARGATMTYTPTRSLAIDVAYRREQRDSNQELRGYKDGLASAGLRFSFR